MHLTVFSEQLHMLTYTQRMHQPDDRQAGINDWQWNTGSNSHSNTVKLEMCWQIQNPSNFIVDFHWFWISSNCITWCKL